ncbi:MAG: DUF4013 domain-containing protein [candidate division NC10 bacterium]|nr:DUF4013 domain-containing protein [candidate division NC10 bacterium]
MQLRIRASLRFPTEGADWVRKLLLGGATGLLLELVFAGVAYLLTEEVAFGVAPLAVLLNFPAGGYVLHLYRDTLRWEAGAMPEWDDWPALFRGGLTVFVVSLAYGIIPFLLLLLGLNLLVRGGIILFLGMVLMVLGVLAGLFVLFFLPMALAHFLIRRRLEAAFHPSLLWEGINGVLPEYMATYLMSVATYILAGLLAAIPYLGPLVWPFAFFYLVLVQARLFGEICARTV